MLSHYLAVAWLNIRRQPFASLVHVLTLSLGLVCFLAAYGVVRFWERADGHFANVDRIFVATVNWEFRDGSGLRSGDPLASNHWLAKHLRSDYPQIEAVARLAAAHENTPVRSGARAVRLRSYAADASLLDIFDFQFVHGDSRNALQPGSVVLTREAAARVFGDVDAVGKTLELFNRWSATVTGVIDRIPEPSHMGRSAAAPAKFDLLMSRDLYEHYVRSLVGRDTTEMAEEWFSAREMTYILLPTDGSFNADTLRQQLPSFVERRIPERSVARFELGLVPLADVLDVSLSDAVLLHQSGISASTVLLLLGGMVLGIACVNFANLATAHAAGRVREIGLRKVIGATARQVMAQYLFEAGLLTTLALAAALAVLALLVPALDNVAGIELSRSLFTDRAALVAFSMLMIGVTVAAGCYPALVLARIRPIFTLRLGRRRVGSKTLATLLVGAQFSVAAFLLIVVCVIFLQNQQLRRLGATTSPDPLLVIENELVTTGLAHATLRNELLRVQHVKSVTAVEYPPWVNPPTKMGLADSPDASDVERTAIVRVVGYDFFETFDMQLLAGRLFDPQRADDVSAVGRPPIGEQRIVITRALAEELGFALPSAAVERVVYMPTNITGQSAGRPYRIIGVVEDKALSISSDWGPRPSVYLFNPALRFHIVRLDSGDVPAALGEIEAVWRKLVPNVALSRRFVDEYFDRSFSSFARVNQAFTGCALIAWAIAAVGLFAMARLVAGRRLHEIGVRKALGASRRQIVLMLLESFSKPVLVANLAAWPFAHIAARHYLEVFIAPIELTVAPFLAALAVSVLIACVAVGGQALRASRVSPARVLQYE